MYDHDLSISELDETATPIEIATSDIRPGDVIRDDLEKLPVEIRKVGRSTASPGLIRITAVRGPVVRYTMFHRPDDRFYRADRETQPPRREADRPGLTYCTNLRTVGVRIP